MNTFVVLSALLAVAVAIPSHSYGGYDGGYEGYGGDDYGKGAILLSSDYNKGDDHSYTTYTKVVAPVITKKIRYEEPIRHTEVYRSSKITPVYQKVVIAKPVIRTYKTYTPVITKSYEVSEPKYISTHGGYGGDDLSYGQEASYGKIISYGKGY